MLDGKLTGNVINNQPEMLSGSPANHSPIRVLADHLLPTVLSPLFQFAFLDTILGKAHPTRRFGLEHVRVSRILARACLQQRSYEVQ